MRRNFGAHEFWIVLVGRGLQVVLAMVGLRVLSTALPMNEVGYYYLIQTFVSWFGLVLVNPVGMFASRMTNQWKKSGSLSRASAGVFSYLVAVSLISVALVAALNFQFDFSSGHSPFTLIAAVALQVLLGCFTQTLLSMLNLSSPRLAYMASSLTVQSLSLLLPVSLIYWGASTAYNWVLGLALANAIGGGLIFYQFLRTEDFKLGTLTLKAVPLRQILGFGIPVACATFLMWIQSQGYRIGIDRWIGRDALAELSIGLGTALSLFAPVESFMQQYLVPQLYQAMDESSPESKAKAWSRIGGAALQFYVTIFICFTLVAPHFLKTLVAPAYQGLVAVFALGLCLELFRVMNNLIYLATHSHWAPQMSLWPYSLGVIVLVIGATGLYLTSTTDLKAIGAVLVLTGFTSFFAMWLRVKKLVNIHWSWSLFFKTNWVLTPLVLFSFWNIDSVYFSFLALGAAGVCAFAALYRLQRNLVHT